MDDEEWMPLPLIVEMLSLLWQIGNSLDFVCVKEIPKEFLVQLLGEELVTKFVIQEMLNSTMADHAIKENLDVKDKTVRTTQTADELKKSFKPGSG
ncbi:hypothetical protein RIF29_28260 [Crotalaria pallida]|uniref:Uncharacterized protein n=1 Tax=Crotalaria pallida TaxID=3830 RepID=A0AAN9ERD7_CROPI